jgi:hypothetical protein
MIFSENRNPLFRMSNTPGRHRRRGDGTELALPTGDRSTGRLPGETAGSCGDEVVYAVKYWT